jgi:hypothetical protein
MTLDVDDDSGPVPFDGRPDEAATENPTTIAAITARLNRGGERMARFEHRMKTLEESVKANTALTKADHDMTSEVHEVILAVRSGFYALAKFGRGLARVGIWTRKALLWAGPPVAIVAGAWHGAGDAIKAWLHGGN